MSLESASRIGQLVPSNPSGADGRRTADDHLRLIKSVLKAQMGNANDEPLTVKFSELNKLLSYAIPVGLCAPFGLPADQVPAGWAPCDGGEYNRSDGTAKIRTPDYRGRGLVGATADRPVGTQFGQQSRTVTTEAAGGHTPSGRVPAANASGTAQINGNTGSAQTGISVSPASVGKVDAGGSASNVPRAPLTTNDPGHSHSFSGSANVTVQIPASELQMDAVGAHGHSVTVNLEQPSVTVLWIMKV